ncbi:hypothetical protein ACT6NV_03105 [Robiginitalea sp. IMCC44478]|uniref:hypothetical protein n=1 Tax=Robiginitalea sp. IMCC44478 TaxID=3459122 RepID=UPI004041C5D0
MKKIKYSIINVFCLSLLIFNSWQLAAQENEPDSASPLSDFSVLIGGEWYLDNSYQTFEWGVGKLSVISKSYFLVDGQAKLVAEGAWIWHPGLKVIKGYFTAVDMPYSFFEYTTAFEGKNMMNALTTYTPDGVSETYQENWEFLNDSSFNWSLFAKTEEGLSKIMGGEYLRK